MITGNLITDKIRSRLKYGKEIQKIRIAVIRYPAAKRTISIYHNQNGFQNYFLSFPSLCFSVEYMITPKGKFEFINLRVAFTDKSKKLKNIYYPQFPNMYSDLHFCMGREWPNFKTVDSMIETVIKRFWGSKFGGDFVSVGGRTFRYEKWAEKTKQYPKWVPQISEMRKIEAKSTLLYFGLKGTES